jgi:hypothetical protein
MRNILTLIFILVSLTINAQVVGKTTVLKVNGNPNLVVGLEDQTGYYESVLAQDTLTGLWYDWKAGRVPVWNLFMGTISKDVTYVSQLTGSNVTGNGSQNYPYADPWFAVDSTNIGGTVFVLDGYYKLDTIGGSYGNVFFPVNGFISANLAKKSINIVNSSNVKYEWSHSYRLPIVYDTIGIKFTFKGGTVKQELTSNESLVRVGKYGKYAPASLHFEPDSLIIGNNGYNSPIVFGNIDKLFIGGKYLKSFRAMVTRGYSTDTLKTEANIVFDEGYLLATDETFSAPKMVGSKLNIMFKKLYVEEDFYVTNFRHGVNAEVNINISDFYLKRWSTVSNQMFLLWAARSASEPMINSTLRFHADNAVLDSLILCEGTANRFANNTGNKVIITGNYTALKRGFFTNNSDNATGQNGVTYYFNNCHVQSTISPPLLVSQGSRVYVNNSNFNSITDTSFVRLSTTARLTVNNSSFTQLSSKSFCQSISGVSSITLNNSSYTGVTPTTVTINSNSPIWKTVVFTGVFGQSTYTTISTKLPTNSPNLVVLKNGLELTDTVDYTYVPSTGVITFIPALTGGEVMKIRWFD